MKTIVLSIFLCLFAFCANAQSDQLVRTDDPSGQEWVMQPLQTTKATYYAVISSESLDFDKSQSGTLKSATIGASAVSLVSSGNKERKVCLQPKLVGERSPRDCYILLSEIENGDYSLNPKMLVLISYDKETNKLLYGGKSPVESFIAVRCPSYE